MPDIPKSLLVVGGGYIGLELGTVYAALGTKVTVVEMTNGLLPGADRDLVNILAKRIESICEAVLLNTKVVSMKEAKNGIAVTFEGEGLSADAAKERTFDRVLVSIGRRPNSAVPGLDRTKVKVNARGFIEVDPARRTAEPSIYAIGDVVGEPMLAHKASHEGRVAVESIAGARVAFEPLAIPRSCSPIPSSPGVGSPRTTRKRRTAKSPSRAFRGRPRDGHSHSIGLTG